MRNRKNFQQELDAEIDSVIDQCCIIVARTEQSAFGHVAEHLTGLRRMSLYVRGLSGIQRQWQSPCLVISTIDVAPAYQRQGIFTKLLAELLRVCRDNQWVLKFENVINPELRTYLERFDFHPAPNARGSEELIGSMYWLPDPDVRATVPQISLQSLRGL